MITGAATKTNDLISFYFIAIFEMSSAVLNKSSGQCNLRNREDSHA